MKYTLEHDKVREVIKKKGMKKMKNKILSLLGLNGGIVLLNAIVLKLTGWSQFFEKGAIAPEGMGETMAVAFGITVLLLSAMAFGYGNYKLLKSMEGAESRPSYSKKYGYVLEEIDTPEECRTALMECRSRVFDFYVNRAIEQVNQFQRKQESMRKILFQKCQSDEKEMYGVGQIVEDAEEMLYENVRHMVSRMSIFDEVDYLKMQKDAANRQNSEGMAAKRALYQEHIEYINKQLEKTDAVLLSYDRLLTEISKLGDDYGKEQEQMAHIQDVVNGMKQLNDEVDQELAGLERQYASMK